MISLRRRLLLGAVLWTVGLCVAAVVGMTFVLLAHPPYARVVHGHAYTHAVLFVATAALAMAAGVWAIRGGISPINQLRARLAAVHAGEARRLEGSYPAEVQPLVDDLNALLARREQAMARALATAGDLAHGLKTPLALLAQEAERARERGDDAVGEAIGDLVERMRRQTDYHLAQARAAAAGAASGARCDVRESVEGLTRTVARLYADKGLAIDARVPEGTTAACQREDLDEMLGNLLDNACKWARARVAISVHAESSLVTVDVEDDGPGVAVEERSRILQRGVRADEAAPGSGLGLAIVRDLVELYGGTVTIDASSLGGLRARLTVPKAS